jgi:hypothetical protein
MRVREIDNRGNLILIKTESGQSSGVFSHSRENYKGDIESTADVVVPHYHKRSADGALFFNPYSNLRTVRFQNGGDCGYTKELSGTDYHADYTGGALWYYGSSRAPLLQHIEGYRIGETLRAEAFTRAKAGVNKALFEGSTEMGELRETIRFLKNPLKSLNRFLKGNRKRLKKQREWEDQARRRSRGRVGVNTRGQLALDYQTYQGAVDVLGDTWLAGRYAVRPLIGSAVSAMRAVDVAVHKVLDHRETSRGFSQQSKTLSKDDGKIASVGYFNLNGTRETQIKTSARAGVMYRTLSRNVWGFDYPDYVSAMWELTWLSFVADWFANTNAYLQALVPKNSVMVLGEWTVTEFEITTLRSVTSEWSNPGSSYTPRGDPGGIEYLRSTGKTRRIGDQTRWTAYHSFNLGIDQILDLIQIGKNLTKG